MVYDLTHTNNSDGKSERFQWNISFMGVFVLCGYVWGTNDRVTTRDGDDCRKISRPRGAIAFQSGSFAILFLGKFVSCLKDIGFGFT